MQLEVQEGQPVLHVYQFENSSGERIMRMVCRDDAQEQAHALEHEVQINQICDENPHILRLKGAAHVPPYIVIDYEGHEFRGLDLLCQTIYKQELAQYLQSKQLVIAFANALAHLHKCGITHNHTLIEDLYSVAGVYKLKIVPECQLAQDSANVQWQKKAFSDKKLSRQNDDQSEKLLQSKKGVAGTVIAPINVQLRDVFGFGLTAFRILIGTEPFQNRNARKEDDRFFKHVTLDQESNFWFPFKAKIKELIQLVGETEVKQLQAFLWSAMKWNSSERPSMQKILGHEYIKNAKQ